MVFLYFLERLRSGKYCVAGMIRRQIVSRGGRRPLRAGSYELGYPQGLACIPWGLAFPGGSRFLGSLGLSGTPSRRSISLGDMRPYGVNFPTDIIPLKLNFHIKEVVRLEEVEAASHRSDF